MARMFHRVIHRCQLEVHLDFPFVSAFGIAGYQSDYQLAYYSGRNRRGKLSYNSTVAFTVGGPMRLIALGIGIGIGDWDGDCLGLWDWDGIGDWDGLGIRTGLGRGLGRPESSLRSFI